MITLRLNGEEAMLDGHPSDVLLDVLRAGGAKGVKEGCAVGVCGACTVLVDDHPVSSCIYPSGSAEGRDVWTIEGLARRFPGVVEAFVRHEALQCGICTPGQITSVCAFLVSGETRDPETLTRFLGGNLCRCTGYGTILEAATEVVSDE